MKKLLLTSAFVAIFTTPLMADEFTDKIAQILDVYAQGDIARVLTELDSAGTILKSLQSDGLGDLLPEALEGWTKVIDSDAGPNMTVLGGGEMAKADYEKGDEYVMVTFMFGGPVVASKAALLKDTEMMLMMGEVTQINGKDFSNNYGVLEAMFGDVLVQVDGKASIETKVEYIKSLNFNRIQAK